MALRNKNIGTANPGAQANASYINALYREKYKRDATAAELKKFSGRTVKDTANLVLGKDTPFRSRKVKEVKEVKGGPEKVSTTPPTTNAGYTGNGGKFGELPKKDKNGNYSWVDSHGVVQQQKDYDSASGSWNYLGDHPASDFTAAETIYKASPPPMPFSAMTEEQKNTYLNQAHQELSSSFINAVQSGQTNLVSDLGNALTTFTTEMDQNNLGVQDDIRKSVAAMEAAGLTFTGASKEKLGEAYSGAGVITPEQLATLNTNLLAIRGLTGTAYSGDPTTGQVNIPMPKPVLTNQDGTPMTNDQQTKAWEDFMQTPDWQDYVNKVNAIATSGTGTGIAGTGQYGYQGNLDPFAGTGLGTAGQGSLLSNRTQLAESYRRNLNTRAREFGLAAENLIGSSNIGSLRLPSLGGINLVNPASNVLGSKQSGYQAETATRGNELAGTALEQYGYQFSL